MGVPEHIVDLKLEDWYSSLSDAARMKLSRYLDKAESSSNYTFFSSIIDCALSDENPKFAVFMCLQIYDICDMDDYQRFLINEKLIDAYIGAERYEDAKAACDANLEHYPIVKERFISDNGGILPKRINFRNRYIDIIVGIDSAYDLAFDMLEKYKDMGLIDAEEYDYRVNSLKTHRLQKIFDGVYSYRPEGQDR